MVAFGPGFPIGFDGLRGDRGAGGLHLGLGLDLFEGFEGARGGLGGDVAEAEFEQLRHLLEEFGDVGALEEFHEGRHGQMEGIGDVGEGMGAVFPEAEEEVELVVLGGGGSRMGGRRV